MRSLGLCCFVVLVTGCFDPVGDPALDLPDSGPVADGGQHPDGGIDAGQDGGADGGASCVDLDKDNYIVSCDKNLTCPGMGRCDCDDSNPAVNSGAKEQCGNKLDDDCNGLADSADPGCQLCGGAPGGKCSSTFDCELSKQTCNAGCCDACPILVPPACTPSQCAHPGGMGGSGCPLPLQCGACCMCPDLYAPVCGIDYATYGNPCEAGCAGIPVLHPGPCLPGEGISCMGSAPGGKDGCGQDGSMYCRDTCPMCGGLSEFRCTQLGACYLDWDCPAGLVPPVRVCDGGTPRLRCVDHACVSVCGA
ncbi:MAG: MopE-related protein [Myxococcaceae bacterium]